VSFPNNDELRTGHGMEGDGGDDPKEDEDDGDCERACGRNSVSSKRTNGSIRLSQVTKDNTARLSLT